ncbi:HET-domain-containing protein [Xylaria arbuscula]|nr:HET-domain-containing protein [Xylaria arbuscula]
MSDVCHLCSNLIYQDRRRQPGLNIHFPPLPFHSNSVKLAGVKASSCRGCRICGFILQVIAHYELQLEDDESLTIKTLKAGGNLLEFPGYQQDAWAGIMKPTELSDYAHSEHAYRFVRSQLETCLKLHPNCVQPPGPGPTRLVDVGLSCDDRVRLIETRSECHKDYVALSYCWGDGDFVRTMTDNYEEFQKEILTSSLPRTIQDAINVTQKLGQKYLWVDALCIIQDSMTDWETESANMGSIYRSSLLTLAAATAASSSDGFLEQGHTPSGTKLPFRQTWYDEYGNETILAARVVPGWNTHTKMIPGADILPLNRRGWTLQERKLSTRMVMYRQEELWWCCISGTSCECGIVDHIPQQFKEHSYSIAAAKDVYKEWYFTVQEYSQRALKFPSDRLPAIAGVAQGVQNLTGSTYIAGLWKDDLLRGLTWEVPPRRPGTSMSGYIGPTFSWVSVKGGVQYSNDIGVWNTAKQCQVLAVESPASGLNPLGQVESGALTISAPLLASVLFYAKGYYTTMISGKEYEVEADVHLETFERDTHGGVVEKSVRRSHIAIAQVESRTPISLLYLGYFSFEGISRIRRAYLVLGKCPTDMTRYERIGYTERFNGIQCLPKSLTQYCIREQTACNEFHGGSIPSVRR